jgi:hypothetical protein
LCIVGGSKQTLSPFANACVHSGCKTIVLQHLGETAMYMNRTQMCAAMVAAFSLAAARADNIQVNLGIAPPADGSAYQIGEEIHVDILIRSETEPIGGISFMQIEFSLSGAMVVDQDGDGVGDIDWAPYGPSGLAGSPATTALASFSQPSGSVNLVWYTNFPQNPATLLNLTPSDPGRGFVSLDIMGNTPGQVTIDTLGPCIQNGSTSGAFAVQWAPQNNFENCDPDPTRDIIQAVLPGAVGSLTPSGFVLTVVPEPGALLLLAVGMLGLKRRAVR